MDDRAEHEEGKWKKYKHDAARSRAEQRMQLPVQPQTSQKLCGHLKLILSIVLASMGHSLEAIVLPCGHIPPKMELKTLCRHLITAWCQGNLGNTNVTEQQNFTAVGNKRALLGRQICATYMEHCHRVRPSEIPVF